MKVWLYYANAGGGHRGPAIAISEELKRRYGNDVSIHFVDFAERSRILKFFLEGGYSFAVHSAEWLYAFFYELSRLSVVSCLIHLVSSWLAAQDLRVRLEAERPDCIIATHFMVAPLLTAIRASGFRVPVYVLVTDPFSAPPIWFYFRDLNYLVNSDELRQQAIQRGVDQSCCHVVPQVVLQNTYSARPKSEVLANFGFTAEKPLVLLVGGGNGFPGVERVIRELLQATIPAQLLVVCGNNKRLQQRVQTIVASSPLVRVVGFVDRLGEVMEAADVVVTKAGASIVHEVLCHDKPLIITHYIWGQERGNMEFVVKNGLGFYEPRTSKVPELVSRCLFDEDVKVALRNARRLVSVKSGVHEAVDSIMAKKNRKT